MNVIQKIFNAGVKESMQKDLKAKVYLNNQIAVYIALIVAFPFIIISYIYFRPITIIPFIGMITCFIAIGISWLGAYNISRMIFSIVPFLLAFIFNAYLSKDGEEPIGGILLLCLSFSLLPFLIFTLKEKYCLLFSITFILAFVLFTNEINELLVIDSMDTRAIRKGFLANISIVVAIVTGWSVVGTMAYFNRKANHESENLLEKMDDQMAQIKESEKKLKSNLQEIEKAQEDEKQRNWINEGLNKFSEILRSGEVGEVIYRKLISTIVEYVGANQGGLFVIEENEEGEKIIKLVSSYAYSRGKFMEKEINIGQGLLGQAYIEGETMQLKQLPNDYVSITSGLGEATPNHLLIVPLKVNDSIEAILEVASFRNFEPFQIDFLEKLGEGIASSVSTIKVDQKTKILLQQSQTQSEEMQAQEEEMRQNMEELQATQEEMARKEKEYIDRIDELESLMMESNYTN